MPSAPLTTIKPLLLTPEKLLPTVVLPANGTHYTLEELYQHLDCATVDVVPLEDELILIIDEEGKFRNPCYRNNWATLLWHQARPAARGVDVIVGRAIYCHTSLLR